MATPEHQRLYKQRLKQRALELIGTRCVWCGSEENVDAAHIRPTPIEGKSARGMNARWSDVIKHSDCYRPMCHKHHRLFDSLRSQPKFDEELIPF